MSGLTKAKNSSVGSVEAIGGLLDLGYPVDPGALEYLLEESLALGDDGPVRVVCRLLEVGCREQSGLANVATFVRRASGVESTARLFKKACKRRGRCPPGMRAWLRRVIEDGPQKKQVAREARVPVQRPGQPVSVLDLRDLACSIDQLSILLDRLSAVDPSADLVRILLGDFTYASGLAILAQYLVANGLAVSNRYEISDCSDKMAAYLGRVGFERALLDPEIRISPDLMDWAVGLTRIGRTVSTERVTAKVVDILDTFVGVTDSRDALVVLLAEMIENVHKHGQPAVDGFAVAQVYPKQLKMGITLVDAGMGVRASYDSGDPSELVDRSKLKEDEDYLREAIRLHSTSKARGHSGYGLYLLSELIKRNRGTFLLASGQATLTGYAKRGELACVSQRHGAWDGTIVSVVIDLHNKLPLKDIYREMPAVAGYEDDDLFVEG